jgi:hypothetical protein
MAKKVIGFRKHIKNEVKAKERNDKDFSRSVRMTKRGCQPCGIDLFDAITIAAILTHTDTSKEGDDIGDGDGN